MGNIYESASNPVALCTKFKGMSPGFPPEIRPLIPGGEKVEIPEHMKGTKMYHITVGEGGECRVEYPLNNFISSSLGIIVSIVLVFILGALIFYPIGRLRKVPTDINKQHFLSRLLAGAFLLIVGASLVFSGIESASTLKIGTEFEISTGIPGVIVLSLGWFLFLRQPNH